MKLKLRIVIFLFAGIYSSSAQTDFENRFQVFANHRVFEHGTLALSIYDLQNQKEIFQYNGNISLSPASTLKVISSTFALGELGKDYSFVTELAYSGKISGDTLTGDLMIIGNGDPTLCSSYLFDDSTFLDWLDLCAEQVIQSGIKFIKGDIVVDASSSPQNSTPESWPWNDLGNYYGAAAYGFNICDNQYYLWFERGNTIGQHCKILRIDPFVPGMELESFVTTAAAGSGDQAYIFGAPFQNDRFITGTIPVGNTSYRIKGSLPDPAYFAAYHLYETLAQKGIYIEGHFKSTYQPGRYPNNIILYRWMSPSLSEIIKVTNTESVNLYAEAIATKSSIAKGTSVSEWMESNMRKLTTQGYFNFEDASGLSPDNKINPTTYTSFLGYLYQQPDLYQVIFPSLSIVGENGTTKNILKSSPAQGHINVKSGLIRYHRNYAGYIETQSGKKLAFSLMAYHPGARSSETRVILEKIMEAIYLAY